MTGLTSVRVCALLLCLSAPAVYPDQTDPRLDALFVQLQEVPNAAQARAVELEIWSIWMQSGRERVDELMAQGARQMSAGRLDAALDTFDRVVERAPEFAEGWNKRATVHYLQDNLAQSVADIRRTLELEPRHFGALSGMGLILLKRGDRAGGLEAFEAVLRIHPHAAGIREEVERLREALRGKAT